MEEEFKTNELFDKFTSFLNNNIPLLLAILLGVTFLFRLKYMNINAGVWWDEADYLRLAKHYAFGLQDIAASYRARALTMVWAVFYRLGADDWFPRLLQQVVSIAAIYFVYLFGKELYNKKVGLVAAIISSVIWVHIFWSTRISLGLHGMFFWVSAGYLFWKGYVKKEKNWYYILAAAILSFGTFAYEATGLSFFFLGFFMLLSDRFSLFTNKKFWFFVLTAFIVATPFMIYNFESFGHVYPRFERTADVYWEPLAEGNLDKWESGSKFDTFLVYTKALPMILSWPFLILFLIGAGMMLFNVVLGFDLIKKRLSLKKELFLVLWATSVLVLFSMIFSTTGFLMEPRFLFPMFPAVSIIAAVALFKLYDYFKKYNRQIAFVAVAAILIWGVYASVSMASEKIDYSKGSFLGEKEAGLWVRENTLPEDFIMSCNQDVIFGYYTERNMAEGFGKNATYADDQIAKYHPKYVLIDIYHPDCEFDIQSLSSYNLETVFVSFVDKEKSRPAVIVYEVVYEESSL